MGQARLAIKFEEDLRKQVKGFRWYGRSKKFEQPNEISQREKNESEIISYYLHCPELRLFIREELLKREIEKFNTDYVCIVWEAISKIEEDSLGENYLHCPDHRLFIREELLKRDIDIFNTEYIRIIWESISSIEVNNLGPNYLNDLKNANNKKLRDDFISINLISLLPDHLALNNFKFINNINIFINPDELFLTKFKNPKHNLLGTLSLLERYKSLKRCRHLIESWSSQRLKTLENCISILIDNSSVESSDSNIEIDDVFNNLNSDAIKFQELYYLERQHINFLDKQRCGNFSSN